MTPSILLTQSIPTSRTTLEDPWSCTSTRISSNSWILFHGRRYISSILTTQDTVHLNGSIDTAACISWLGDITGLSKRGLMGLVLDTGSSATNFGGSLMVSTWARSGTWTGCTGARGCSGTGCLGLAPSFSVSTVLVEDRFNSWSGRDLAVSSIFGLKSVDGGRGFSGTVEFSVVPAIWSSPVRSVKTANPSSTRYCFMSRPPTSQISTAILSPSMAIGVARNSVSPSISANCCSPEILSLLQVSPSPGFIPASPTFTTNPGVVLWCSICLTSEAMTVALLPISI